MQHLAQSKCSVGARFKKPIHWPEVPECGVLSVEEPDCSPRGEMG